MTGIQFYLEILDKDSNKNDLIDRFAINVSNPVNSSINRANYTGVFGIATLEVSLYIVNLTEDNLTEVNNGYELLVTIFSYRNPSHRCAGCNRCCDGNCNTGLCDTYFYFCVRPFKTFFTRNVRIMQEYCPPDEEVITENEKDGINGTTFNNNVLGVANPIIFSKIANVSHTYTNNNFY